MHKITKTLLENNMWDKTIMVYCTKWNAYIGARIISVNGEDLYITPVSFSRLKVNKTLKISKEYIKDIRFVSSVWKGIKVVITFKTGESIKMGLINRSWAQQAQLLTMWTEPNIEIKRQTMTVGEAFLLDCRQVAREINSQGEDFTISQLVNRVNRNKENAKEWIASYSEKIYNALKEDIANGKLNAKIIVVKSGDKILYEKIKFIKK